ncbi:MAG: IPT/TIG domain-containing protein, partial [Myxococcota bacterium]
MTRSLYLLLLAGVGCAPLSQLEDYYETWDPPSISGLSVTSEAGNIGGGTLTIDGSGFGTDPDQIVVQFGDDNADILSISDSAIEVVVPSGPISGGAVDVRIATATGTATAAAAYTYDVGDLYASQVGHIQVNNFWESCYGGLSGRLDDEYGTTGCQDLAYIGYAGIDGVAESLTFQYPRLHAENIGFMGGTDQGSSEWVLERPGQIGFVSGVDELHADIGKVVLRNDIWEGDAWCPDLDAMASYRYGGGVEGFLDPVSVTGSDVIDGSSCEIGDAGAYDLSELWFCTSPSEDGSSSFVYRPDWPIKKNFFAGKKNDWTKSATITVSAPEVGIDGLEIDVPESLVVYNTEGFDPVVEGAEGAQDLWSLSTLQGCFDDAGSGESLDDVALRFEWTPSKVSEDDGTFDCSEAGDLCAQKTYVRLTLTALSLNWFGTVGYPVRATLVVDDSAPRGEERASLEVPASVLYQIPSVRLPQGGGLAGDGLLDSTVSDWGYVVMTFERVTDYAIRTDSGDTVVFSYTTGDFGFFG